MTPILTVFFPTGNGGSDLTDSEAQLTCMKAIELNEAMLETMSPGGPESGASKAGVVMNNVALLMAVVAALISVM